MVDFIIEKTEERKGVMKNKPTHHGAIVEAIEMCMGEI